MSAPSAFYRQHQSVEAPLIDARHFRQAWRVRTRLDRLFADRAISARAYRACCEFRDLADCAEAGALGRPGFIGARASGYSGTDRLEARLAAQTRLHEIALHLGTIAFALLEMLIVKNLSWTVIGRGFHIDPRTARAWCITVINALAQI